MTEAPTPPSEPSGSAQPSKPPKSRTTPESEALPTLSPLPGVGLRRRPLHEVRARRRKITGLSLAAALAICVAAGAAAWQLGVAVPDQTATRTSPPVTPAPTSAPTPTPTPTPTPDPEPTESPEPTEPPAPQYDLNDPASITVVVNKQRPFNPIDWEPLDLVMPQGIDNTNGQPLRAEAAQALEAMHAEATAAGVPFFITSAYRPYWMQLELFDSYVVRDGMDAADTYSARAGFSEHQSGLTADLDDGSGCAFQDCFGDTPAGLWLRENAPRFGFILRYERGEEATVGYIYEPWHFRYVGVAVATDMAALGQPNLESYFGLPAAPGY